METSQKTEMVKPKYEFAISSKQSIRVNLQHDGEGYGKGINNLIKLNDAYPGQMSAIVCVNKYSHTVDTPIGGIESWEIDESYPRKQVVFKTIDEFVALTKEVEEKMLDYFSK